MNIFGRKHKKDGDSSAGGGSSKSGSKSKATSRADCQVLTVPLKQAVRNSPSFDGIPIPAVVRECLDYVTLYGLHVEGIYRVSSPKSRLDELEMLANSDRQDEIIFQDAHEAAGLLKRFLRQLPEHILTPELHNQFELVATDCHCDPAQACVCSQALKIKELLLQLPTENFHLLAFVFRHTQLVIQQEPFNKMGLAALGVLLQAMLNLKRPIVKMFILNAANTTSTGTANAVCSSALGGGAAAKSGGGQQQHQLQPCTQLFDAVDTSRPYLKPLSIEQLRQNPPNTVSGIEEEIFKQQNLLEHLHERVQQQRQHQQHGRDDSCRGAREDHMWAVQTGITVLKRRLKALQDAAEEQQQQQDACREGGSGDGENGLWFGTQQDGQKKEDSDESMQSALLEKQLLAVQMALREEIGDEKRKIAHLLSTLRELRTQLPAEEQARLTASQRNANTESQQHRPRSVVSVRSSNGGSGGGVPGGGGHVLTTDGNEDDGGGGGQQHQEQVNGSANWEELARVEEARREELLADLIRYRRICAQLRARLEHDTMLVKVKKHQQQQQLQRPGDDNANALLAKKANDSAANLLVTRF